MVIKKYLKYVFIFILLYLYLFNPYILVGSKTWGTMKILYVFLIAYFIDRKFLYLLWCFRYEAFVFFLIIGYSFIWGFVGGGDKVFIYTGIVNLIELLLLPIILAYLLNFYLEEESFSNILIFSIFCATAISIILFLTPELSQLVRTYTLLPDSKFFNLEHRGFGLASGLSYSYPIFLGIFVAVIFSMKMNFVFRIILLLMIAFAIAINARIGFAAVIVSVFLLIFNKKLNIFYKFFVILVGIFFSILIFNMFEEHELTKKWILSFFHQISDFFFGTELATEGTISTLGGRMLIFPDNLSQWFFGRGYSIFGTSSLGNVGVGSSDVGYVIQINYGGLVYFFLWVLLFLFLFRKGLKIISIYLVLVFLITLLISNIKGNSFYSNDFSRFIVLYICYFYLKKKYFYNYSGSF